VLASRVRRTLTENQLLRPGDRVLCALSGGPDSTALLHVLKGLAPELGFALEAATVDHGLRPAGADEARSARELADSLGVPCAILSLGLAPGAGAQARARDARYAALRDRAREVGAAAIAVGHTLDDQAETVVLRLLRGSGVRGLAGVLPRREDGVIRPLLDARRAEVLDYLAHHRLEAPVRDPSNEDLGFQRVRVRHAILPALVAESPELPRTLAALADEARAIRDFVGGLASALVVGQPRDRLDGTRLSALAPPVRREVLRLWAERLCGAPPRRPHLDALEAALAGRGEASLSGGFVVRTEGKWLRALEGAWSSGSREAGPGGSADPDEEPVEEA
jgi:tRNA(Ile)-lysidine synthase